MNTIPTSRGTFSNPSHEVINANLMKGNYLSKKLTLAEVKRRLQPGVMISLIWHFHMDNWRDAAVQDAIQSPEGYRRPVGKVQGNAITLVGDRDGRPNHSWLYWPKAADFRGEGNEFEILKGGQPFMKYRIEG